MQETRIWSLGQEDPMEEETATHSSTLAWEIPWTEEPGRLHDLVTKNNNKQQFIFGCAGSSLLSVGFLQLWRVSGGYSPVVMCRLLIEVVSFVAEHGLEGTRASVVAAHRLQSADSVVVLHGLSCPRVCGILPVQGLNPCLLHLQGRLSTPWTTREAPHCTFLTPPKQLPVLGKFFASRGRGILQPWHRLGSSKSLCFIWKECVAYRKWKGTRCHAFSCPRIPLMENIWWLPCPASPGCAFALRSWGSWCVHEEDQGRLPVSWFPGSQHTATLCAFPEGGNPENAAF